MYKIQIHKVEIVLDSINQYLDVTCFPSLRIEIGFKIRSEKLNCLNFGNVSRVVGLENVFLLAKMAENDFVVRSVG